MSTLAVAVPVRLLTSWDERGVFHFLLSFVFEWMGDWIGPRPANDGGRRLVGPLSPFFTFLSFPIKLSATQFTGFPLHFLVVGYFVKQFLLLLLAAYHLWPWSLSLSHQSTPALHGRRRSAIRATRVTDLQRSTVRGHLPVIFFGPLSDPAVISMRGAAPVV